jgi:hypothetical protein
VAKCTATVAAPPMMRELIIPIRRHHHE